MPAKDKGHFFAESLWMELMKTRVFFGSMDGMKANEHPIFLNAFRQRKTALPVLFQNCHRSPWELNGTDGGAPVFKSCTSYCLFDIIRMLQDDW